MIRLHVITTGPGVSNPCDVCLLEHTDCTLQDCDRIHKYLLDEDDLAGLVRTGGAKYTSKPEPL